MTVVVGTDGAAKIDLGSGLKYMANIRSWELSVSRPSLSRTNLGDEAERSVSGVAKWTGDFEFHLVFSEDESVALSSWKMLEFALAGVGDELFADIELILQRHQIAPDFEVFRSTIPGVIKLSGTVLVTDVRMDCTDPGEPIVMVADWEGDGALTPVRET
jgi:hypothetical protein